MTVWREISTRLQSPRQKAQSVEFEATDNTATKNKSDSECTEETQCLNGSNNDHNSRSFLPGAS